MALPILISAFSGHGKSFSIKGFADEPETAAVIAAEKSRLPFKSSIRVARVPESFPDARTMAQVHRKKYEWIMQVIATARCKNVIIDDSQYLLINEMFDRAQESGYQKYLDMAKNFRDLVHFVNALPEEDKIVFFLHHAEYDMDGRAKAKTVGKMLDEKLVLEGCFDVHLYCKDKHFYTQSAGMSTAKTPEGMFDEIEIPNNLKIVADAARAYYGM